MSEPEDCPAAPDSTTREQRLGFSHGEDVLLQHEDGKYYLGTIVKVDLERCLVKFLDNTSAWSSVKELTKLTIPDSDVMCVLCKKSQPKDDNDIVVCDKCGRGYHQLCHQPQVSNEDTSPDSHWICKRCADCQPRAREGGDPKNSMIKANIRKVCSGRDQPQPPPEDMTKLPYDPKMLSWDTHHRVNAEQIYCYCGLNGEWYTQMLQCVRCKQWFHEKCVGCLSYPLYSGDRFYIFVCSTCNYGKEFVRRLDVKWVDLVHLMLYNLTVYNAKKYYDLDTKIIPYAEDNWDNFQLPSTIRKVTPKERRETILTILTSHKNRFKCGREIKKRTTIWGLRVRLPPPCPIINLPSSGFIDEDSLKHSWTEVNKKLQHLPPPSSFSSPQSIENPDSTIPSQSNDSISLPESTKRLTPVKQRPVEIVDISIAPPDVEIRDTVFQNTPIVDDKTCPSPSENKPTDSTQALRERYSGGGFVKKSVPFPKLSLQRRRRLMALGSTRKRIMGNNSKEENIDNELIKAKEEREARYRKARKLLKNAIAKSKTRTPEVPDLPPTPPTSVSGPPTPPATTSSSSSSSASAMSELSVPSSMMDLPPSTPVDTSGDETSSRGTLDSFIPPPKDFEGKNNPFRNLSDLLGTSSTPGQSTSNTTLSNNNNHCPITLPLSLTPVITQPPIKRPKKRKLCEKDIIVDSNGQVKRRRQHRRGRPPNSSQNQHQQTASKTAAILPPRSNEVKSDFVRNLRSSYNNSNSSTTSTNNQIGNCVDYALNGRRLRQRQSNDKITQPDVQQQKNHRNVTISSPKCSPVKQNPTDINMDDLKSSVNIYFGAANRIASGEQFVLRAKRISPNGQLQYLIEWEGLKT